MVHYDAIVIGTGQAGPPLARYLADQGKTVAIAEGGTFGGSCVNFGCTPSKAMIGSANAIRMAQRGGDFGFTTGEVKADFTRVVERRDEIVRESREGLIKSLEKRKNITLYREYARFEAPKQVRVGDQVIEGDKIYLNTGTRSAIPHIDGLDKVPFLDNVRLMGLTELPSHLIILGAGYIGLELALAFRRYGSQVTVIDRSAVLIEHEDPEFSKTVHKMLTAEGVRFAFNAEAQSAKYENRQMEIKIKYSTSGYVETLKGSHFLIAAGRVPNSDKIGADEIGLARDKRGFIEVDAHLATNVEGVYALGDVNGRGAFTHTSYDDYLTIVDNLQGGTRKISDRITAYAMYIDPPLAHIGMSETEVRAKGLENVLEASMPMAKVNRAIEYGQTQGMMKVLVDGNTQQFLGVTILGLYADEAIHSFLDLMYAKAPYTVMKNAMHIHPTVSELLPVLLTKLQPMH
jgi:pyruvate/2-oxoglutarate dehydrogenase complex dihydrolipoamide dehydrogenase (E3) component